MTSPVSYCVEYELSSRMSIDEVDRNASVHQWAELRNTLVANGIDVAVCNHVPDYCPDIVFARDYGITIGNIFLKSNFLYEERKAEEIYIANKMKDFKYEVVSCPHHFEAGDIIVDSYTKSLWFAFGNRSDFKTKAVLDELYDQTELVTRPVHIKDKRFTHLDLCFNPLANGCLLWYPEAFDDYSRSLIDSWYPVQIKVSEEDAMNGVCSSLSYIEGDDLLFIGPKMSDSLWVELRHFGIINELDVTEFSKGGGSVKSLVLEL